MDVHNDGINSSAVYSIKNWKIQMTIRMILKYMTVFLYHYATTENSDKEVYLIMWQMLRKY